MTGAAGQLQRQPLGQDAVVGDAGQRIALGELAVTALARLQLLPEEGDRPGGQEEGWNQDEAVLEGLARAVGVVGDRREHRERGEAELESDRAAALEDV